jgi:hypothetical protein
MMQATDFADGDNLAQLRRLDRPSIRCIFGEGEVRSGAMVWRVPNRQSFPRNAGFSTLKGIQVTTPLAFVCCRAHAQRVIPRRTPQSIRAGDAPCRCINPFRRSHIFAVGAA